MSIFNKYDVIHYNSDKSGYAIISRNPILNITLMYGDFYASVLLTQISPDCFDSSFKQTIDLSGWLKTVFIEDNFKMNV
jgi:hypothetical protein